MSDVDNPKVELREGIFYSKHTLDDFKRHLPEEAIIIREDDASMTWGYDSWTLLYWMPKSLLV